MLATRVRSESTLKGKCVELYLHAPLRHSVSIMFAFILCGFFKDGVTVCRMFTVQVCGYWVESLL